MIKLIGYLKRKPGLAVEEFQRRWLAHGVEVATLPGLRRYVQSHTLLNGYRKGQPIYDGLAELWFEDVAACRVAVASRAAAKIKSERATFADQTSVGRMLMRDHVIKDGPLPADAVRSIEFVTRKVGLPVADFQHHWRDRHGPLAARIPVVLRYVQSHALAEDYQHGSGPPWDGLALTWFASTDAMRFSATTPEYAATLADDHRFVTPGQPPLIIAREHVIVE
jgi:uncharacterized protein (TIGR02118 family)